MRQSIPYDSLAMLAVLSSSTFMLMVVGTSSICAVLVALNLTSLKHKSTNRLCVYGAVILMLGIIIGIVAMGLGGLGKTLPLFSSVPGRISVGMVVAAVLASTIGLIQLMTINRYRRGRKRGFFTLVAAAIFTSVLFYVDFSARHPKAAFQTGVEDVIPIDPTRAVPLNNILPTPQARQPRLAPPTPSPSTTASPD